MWSLITHNVQLEATGDPAEATSTVYKRFRAATYATGVTIKLPHSAGTQH